MKINPEQRRARRISAANRPENVPRPDFKSRTTFGAKVSIISKTRTTFDGSAKKTSPDQRRAKRVSAANLAESVSRPDKTNGFYPLFAPHRAAGPVRGSAARAWTRTVLQPIARCPTFALRPRKSFAIVHRDRSLRRSVSADRRHRWLRSAAPLRVLRWESGSKAREARFRSKSC